MNHSQVEEIKSQVDLSTDQGKLVWINAEIALNLTRIARFLEGGIKIKK